MAIFVRNTHTGENYQPNGVFVPFLPHTRTTKVMRQQLALDKPTAKRCWSHIVKTKITNQSRCLNLARRPGSELLDTLSRSVRSGDPDNLEAQASAHYFRNLFGIQFTRTRTHRVNSALNYGYAIFRGAIARVLVSHGFLPAFGLHHHSEQNAFNLADDLIEPFRPLVDLFVASEISDDDADLTTSDKASLVELLHYDLETEQGHSTRSGLAAIEHLVASLLRVVGKNDHQLLELPLLIPLKVHSNEC
ncbi:MAG: type II CRISPR-associated endonuclease Cas1 [Candidatus Obscuribacter sp.]|nr:type II CRISPR-associated endonuclease Cas1 [Candidatus Obscuribacter sp.]